MGAMFYVYEHWRPDRGECFYVGKGQKQRAHDMRRGRNRYHKFVQKKLNDLGFCVEVRIVASGLTEDEAFALEIERIAFWRADGAPLTNLFTGGEGPSGWKHSEEWKRANSERNKGRKHTEETKARIAAAHKGKQWALGYKKTPEQIEKTASVHRGRTVSSEVKAKLRALATARLADEEVRERIRQTTKKQMTDPAMRELLRERANQQWADPVARAAKSAAMSKAVLCVTTGEIYTSAKAAAKACGVSSSKVSDVCRGDRPHTKQMVFQYIVCEGDA